MSRASPCELGYVDWYNDLLYSHNIKYWISDSEYWKSDVLEEDRGGRDVNSTSASGIEYLPRSRRRQLVVAALLSYPVAYAVLVALKQTSLNRWIILAVFGLLLLPTLATLSVGYRYARGRIDGRHLRLDERDLALRQQAYALSHRVLAVIVVAATAVTEIYLTSGNTLRLDANTFLPAVMWLALYIPALPSLMLAWIETDRPADA